MKKILTGTLSLIIISLMSSAVVAKGDVPRTKAAHLAQAQNYEKLAAQQQAVVREHVKMKREYRSNQASLPKQTRDKSLAEMDAHCDALISAARSEAEEYRAISKWHRMRAREMQ